MKECKKVFKLAVSIGEMLLESGGEIYRVQETIGRILSAYGIEDYNVFVLSNGIFATIYEDKEEHGSMVRYVPLSDIHLGNIGKLNQLSREICDHAYTIEEAFEKLEQCKEVPEIVGVRQILTAGMGGASFCYIFGGGWLESVVAFFLCMMLQRFVVFAKGKEFSKFIINIVGSGLVTAVSLLLVLMEFPVMQDKVVIGAIVILLPGVALTTSIRELFHGNYLSGSIRLMDALLTAFCIATGVGGAIQIFQLLGGIGS